MTKFQDKTSRFEMVLLIAYLLINILRLSNLLYVCVNFVENELFFIKMAQYCWKFLRVVSKIVVQNILKNIRYFEKNVWGTRDLTDQARL